MADTPTLFDAAGRLTPDGRRLSDRLLDRTMDRLRRGDDAPAEVRPFPVRAPARDRDQ
jgi:hypothetical protein